MYKMAQNGCNGRFTMYQLYIILAAQFCLGVCYYNEIGIKRDYNLAFIWMQQSSFQGVPAAMNLLGNMYVEGQGVDIDPVIGMLWYMQSAESREPAALYNIGTLFERGLGI
jgi:TPR repeat protein